MVDAVRLAGTGLRAWAPPAQPSSSLSVVVTLTAILLARTELFAGALLWTSAAVSGMLLWRYERTLDDRLSDLDNRILVQVGYR